MKNLESKLFILIFFSPQGQKGSGGLPGHPGEDGGQVSTKSFFFFFKRIQYNESIISNT